MSIHFKAVVQKVPNAKEGEQPKYYARICNGSPMNIRELGKEIALRTSLSGVDVSAVIDAFFEILPLLLLNGRIISLRDFGTFSLSLTSAPSDTPEEVHSKNILRTNLQFRPKPELKEELQKAKFIKVH